MSTHKSATNKYFEEAEWNERLQQLQNKYENKKTKKFKPFVDSLGELIINDITGQRKLQLSEEAKATFRIGKAGERFEKRNKKLTSKERLYALEVEESLLEVIVSIVDLYNVLPKDLMNDDEQELIKFLRDKRRKMKDNINHKRDRIERPEVYTDINHRYDTQKRIRNK